MCSLTYYRFKQQILKWMIIKLGHGLHSPCYSPNQTLAILYISHRLMQNISSLKKGFLNVKDSLPKELEYFSSKRKAIISLGVPCFHAREIFIFLLSLPPPPIEKYLLHLNIAYHSYAMRHVPSLCSFTILSSCPVRGSIIVEWIWLVLAFRCTFLLEDICCCSHLS